MIQINFTRTGLKKRTRQKMEKMREMWKKLKKDKK